PIGHHGRWHGQPAARHRRHHSLPQPGRHGAGHQPRRDRHRPGAGPAAGGAAGMSFDARVWRLGNVITLAVVLLSARIVFWTLVRADSLRPVTVSEAAAEAYVLALR